MPDKTITLSDAERDAAQSALLARGKMLLAHMQSLRDTGSTSGNNPHMGAADELFRVAMSALDKIGSQP